MGNAARRAALILFAMAILCSRPALLLALGQVSYITTAPAAGAFPIVANRSAAPIFVDPADYPGVARAASDLNADIQRVTGMSSAVLRDPAALKQPAILIGTIGHSPLIDRLIREGKVDASGVASRWESFVIQTVSDPLPGISSGLVVAGSDKRGTIFGIYDISEQIGVSPWYWWADVPARHADALLVRPGRYAQGEPSVRYRGIFLNDEAPDLTNWVREKYGTVPNLNGVANYNRAFYGRIFEVILRLKGNYLWPAMWNNAFNEDDPENARLADEYGIVMGTSHQEPMLRAQKEWDRRYQRTLGSWNYYKNPDVLQQFWREGIHRNKRFESIITLGLRGANDSEMIPGGTVQQSMDLLKQIVDVQRKMIAEEINPDLTKVPQLWCPYKEVLEYYERGFEIPDDVTILWTDDNWGNIRRLPTEAERKRSGGAGIYYHFDYVGGPRNYKWINTNPIPKIWQQMTMAKAYGADRIWIVNVGHFKGLEFPIEYFMHLAWNTPRWTSDNIDQYTRDWAAREFGAMYAEPVASLISRYTQYNGRRKPELLSPTTYSLVHYGEADRVVADYHAAASDADVLYQMLPKESRDAFDQLVRFPIKACAQVNELYVAAGRNELYAQQGRASANDQADAVERLFQADADLMDYYNHTMAGGKWNHFMDQVHIGYTSWQDPLRNIMPRTRRIDIPAGAALGVAVEGSADAWPRNRAMALPRFDALNQQRRWIDLFTRAHDGFDFTASPSEPWITLSSTAGHVQKEQRLWVEIDWSKLNGKPSGIVTIAGAGESAQVQIDAIEPADITRQSLRGFAEADRYVSIEAPHFSANVPAGETRWATIDDYGHTLAGMTILPIDAPSVTPPAGAARLEYQMYLYEPGSATVTLVVAPTLNVDPSRSVRIAASFDDAPPQVLTIVPKDFNASNGNREWENSVRNNARDLTWRQDLAAGGYHTLKVWMVDPGVVLQKIVVDLGGAQRSYLKPPETYHTLGVR
jgi:hypothetical protein